MKENASFFGDDPPAVAGIVRELLKPENADLLFAVMRLGDSPDESFMSGFAHVAPISFDDFAKLARAIDAQLAPALGIEPDSRSMDARYGEHVRLMEDKNRKAALDEAQTARFNALVAPYDDGWSGAYYGLLMRRVQARLIQMAHN